MKVKTSDIAITAVMPSQYPADDLPEIAMIGRSNVGKSSTINTILNRKNLARVSANPGKTRTINFYIINKEFYLVDLPGYGYAKVARSDRAAWGKMIETYLSTRNALQEVLLLVDIRHTPSEDDVLMYNWLRQYGYGSIVIATKSDKISKNQQQKSMKVIRETLGMPTNAQIVPISSLKKLGIDKLWGALESLFIENQLNITIEEQGEI
ncbi:ribosome biogenesis GTP-binding protein YihA/YsxC [Serpentinicella alkaliphila]|uniref:Probable GTP-binding protein EngB n=1 Tax=Serpentinicella alkaliphila TaxID=1734049 RepID=A0A4R2TK36_9FIRM|nr:ribosome biogenesis GTP-binding protein YihA/YsxC [Serpentinicella alkaliphila]QUH24721.1 YihA family ribosome biogenesis GTP-binding protein [Serpentinicella alkaliphila]TCQ03711.1 GTP-binding protein [Serpentinicella alkaliphila]